jgi:hypothetical protein
MKTVAILIMKSGLLVLAGGCYTLNQPDDPCWRDEATVLIGPGQLHMKPECVSTVPGGTEPAAHPPESEPESPDLILEANANLK